VEPGAHLAAGGSEQVAQFIDLRVDLRDPCRDGFAVASHEIAPPLGATDRAFQVALVGPGGTEVRERGVERTVRRVAFNVLCGALCGVSGPEVGTIAA